MILRRQNRKYSIFGEKKIFLRRHAENKLFFLDKLLCIYCAKILIVLTLILVKNSDEWSAGGFVVWKSEVGQLQNLGEAVTHEAAVTDVIRRVVEELGAKFTVIDKMHDEMAICRSSGKTLKG